MADEIRVTSGQLKALVAKLDTIDLTDDERLVMQAVFAAAAEDAEVAGYDFVPTGEGQARIVVVDR